MAKFKECDGCVSAFCAVHGECVNASPMTDWLPTPGKQPVADDAGCSLGVGCDEYGICYAEAHGQPQKCPHYREAKSHDA